MIQFTHSARRAVLLLIALATATAAWESTALAGEKYFNAHHDGALSNDTQFMVTFYVYDTAPPMPHWVLDTSIEALYLEYSVSDLIVAPSYYANWYNGTRSGFINNTQYTAKLYYYDTATENWIYVSGQDISWLE